MRFELEGIEKSFEELVRLGICPDCGGNLDYNDECPGWYDEKPDPGYNLIKLLEEDTKLL